MNQAAMDIDRLQRLLELSRFMSEETNVDRLLDYIVREVSEALACDRCAVFLLDEEAGEIWSKVATGEESIRFPAGQGIAGETIAEAKTIFIEDAYEDKRFNKEVDKLTGYTTRNILSVPLFNRAGKSIGCFEVINKLKGQFTEADSEFLKLFGTHAAGCIESALLHEQNARVIAAMKVIHELEQQLSAAGSLDALLQFAIEKAALGCNAEAGSIIMPEGGDKRLVFAYRMGDNADQLTQISLQSDEGIAGQVLASGQSVLENKISENSHHSARVDDALSRTTRNLIAVPLKSSSSMSAPLLGVIEVINSKNGHFTHEQMNFLEVISSQISSMIERRRLQEEQHRSERLATIGQLASTILHDLKNPLTIVKGYSELVGFPDTTEDQRTEYCKVIGAQIDRCVSMTREVLSFARGDKSFNAEQIELSRLFDEVIMLMELEAEKNKIRFVADLDVSGAVSCDLEKIKRVLFNLSNNAMEALAETINPQLTLAAREVTDSSNNNWVEISVSDNGPGVPVEIRDKLFQPFATFNKRDGTGLGLHISLEIAKLHQGSLTLSEAKGGGAMFVLRIPRS